MSEQVFTTSELKELKEFEGRQVVLVAKIGSGLSPLNVIG